MWSNACKWNYSTSLRYSIVAHDWDRTDFKRITMSRRAGRMLVLTNLTGISWRSTDETRQAVQVQDAHVQDNLNTLNISRYFLFIELSPMAFKVKISVSSLMSRILFQFYDYNPGQELFNMIQRERKGPILWNVLAMQCSHGVAYTWIWHYWVNLDLSSLRL